MCYIFEKHGIQGYQIWHSRVSNVKYTNNKYTKYTNTHRYSLLSLLITIIHHHSLSSLFHYYNCSERTGVLWTPFFKIPLTKYCRNFEADIKIMWHYSKKHLKRSVCYVWMQLFSRVQGSHPSLWSMYPRRNSAGLRPRQRSGCAACHQNCCISTPGLKFASGTSSGSSAQNLALPPSSVPPGLLLGVRRKS